MEKRAIVTEWVRVDYLCDDCGHPVERTGNSFLSYGGVVESHEYICPKCKAIYKFPVSTTYPYYEGVVGTPKLKVEDLAAWNGDLRCSNCDEYALRDENGYFMLTKYCPHCGKRMFNDED